MTSTRLPLPAALATFTASAEVLTVASFVPPQHHTNLVMFARLADELAACSGGDLTLQVFPAGQSGAVPVQQHRGVVESVADITFGVSAYAPRDLPSAMLAILPGRPKPSPRRRSAGSKGDV